MRNRHGHTPAAWSAVLLVLVGGIVLSFGVGSQRLVLALVGAAVVLLAPVVAKVLQRLGLGQYPPQQPHGYANAQAYLGARQHFEHDHRVMHNVHPRHGGHKERTDH